jgi:putative transposase
MTAVLLRLAYLGLTHTFAVFRLLPIGDRDEDTEILVLRHQIALLQRQLPSRQTRRRRAPHCQEARTRPDQHA